MTDKQRMFLTELKVQQIGHSYILYAHTPKIQPVYVYLCMCMLTNIFSIIYFMQTFLESFDMIINEDRESIITNELMVRQLKIRNPSYTV